MATSFAAIAGVIGGALAVLGLIICLVCSQFRKFSNKDSETGSSDHSAAGPAQNVSHHQEARQFTVEELEQASGQFSESNLIGCGSFGLVYKGLLSDGTVVAIKRRNGRPKHEFIEEVAYLSTIQHRNLVTLLGYCQERGSQMLVFEYLPNGSMCSHLYGKGSTTKLEFKQRLSIAIGAARAGLCHLHGLQPPLTHNNFKTANVLVDENFIAKVADAGVMKLLEKMEDASWSSSRSYNPFRDPELGPRDTYHEANDVYSFGVFLAELISGKEANYGEAFCSNESILQWIQDHLSTDDLVDTRLSGSFTEEGMRDLIKLMIKCMRFPGTNRLTMEDIVMELDQIIDKEITRTTVMGEGTATVTLGSQLFSQAIS